MKDFQNKRDKKKSDRERNNQSLPKKKMTKYIYRSFKENDLPIEDWVREELIEEN